MQTIFLGIVERNPILLDLIDGAATSDCIKATCCSKDPGIVCELVNRIKIAPGGPSEVVESLSLLTCPPPSISVPILYMSPPYESQSYLNAINRNGTRERDPSIRR